MVAIIGLLSTLCSQAGKQPLGDRIFSTLYLVMSPQVPSGRPHDSRSPGTGVTVGGGSVTLISHRGPGQPPANDFLFPSYYAPTAQPL